MAMISGLWPFLVYFFSSGWDGAFWGVELYLNRMMSVLVSFILIIAYRNGLGETNGLSGCVGNFRMTAREHRQIT